MSLLPKVIEKFYLILQSKDFPQSRLLSPPHTKLSTISEQEYALESLWSTNSLYSTYRIAVTHNVTMVFPGPCTRKCQDKEKLGTLCFFLFTIPEPANINSEHPAFIVLGTSTNTHAII